jgi:hypothetical protein
MKNDSERCSVPLASVSSLLCSRRGQMHSLETPQANSFLAASAPEKMVRIEGGDYLFRVRGIEIEGPTMSA